MRISDWSSDVCSSDLRPPRSTPPRPHSRSRRNNQRRRAAASNPIPPSISRLAPSRHAGLVPASNPPRAVAFEARWTPEHVRGDGRAEPVLQPNAWSSNLASRNPPRSEEHTSELQSLMRTPYAVLCLTKKKRHKPTKDTIIHNA